MNTFEVNLTNYKFFSAIGRLLEDMDIFAVHLVFKHTLIPTLPENTKQSPFSIVTALVDRIFFHGKLNFDQDIKMSGHVTWVGRSSAESCLILEQQREDGTWERVTEASFVLVARYIQQCFLGSI